MSEHRRSNLLPNNLSISSDRLLSIVSDYRKVIEEKNSWQAPLGILVSIVMCIVATKEYQPVFGFNGEQVQVAIYMFGVGCFIWLVRKIISYCKSNPENLFEQDIINSIKNVPEFTVVYIVKLTKDGIPRVLVEEKQSWKCFFLPYVASSRNAKFSIEKLSELQVTIASLLGISSKSVTVEHLRDYSLVSEKYSPTDETVKQFNFDFFFFTVPKVNMVKDYKSSPFKVGGRVYYWKTINELMDDEATMLRNGDVIEHLNKHYSELLANTGESFK